METWFGKFKVGDLVRCINRHSRLDSGKIYKVAFVKINGTHADLIAVCDIHEKIVLTSYPIYYPEIAFVKIDTTKAEDFADLL